MAKAILVVLLLLSTLSAFGQVPDAPQPQKFLTPETTGLILADAAAKGADWYYTERNAGIPGFCERDPIARPFMYHRGTALGFFGGVLALDVITAYELHKHGHNKLAKIALAFGIVDNGIGAGYSGTH